MRKGGTYMLKRIKNGYNSVKSIVRSKDNPIPNGDPHYDKARGQFVFKNVNEYMDFHRLGATKYREEVRTRKANTRPFSWFGKRDYKNKTANTSVVNPAVGKTSADNPAVGKTSADNPSVVNPDVGKTSADNPAVVNPAVGNTLLKYIRAPWASRRRFEDPEEKRVHDILDKDFNNLKKDYNDIIKGPHFNEIINAFVDNIKKVKNDKELKQITLILSMMLKRFENKGFLDDRTIISWEEFQNRKERIDPLLSSIQKTTPDLILDYLKNILIELTDNIYENKIKEVEAFIQAVSINFDTWAKLFDIVKLKVKGLDKKDDTLISKFKEFKEIFEHFRKYKDDLPYKIVGFRRYGIIKTRASDNGPFKNTDNILNQFNNQYIPLTDEYRKVLKAIQTSYDDLKKMLSESISSPPKQS